MFPKTPDRLPLVSVVMPVLNPHPVFFPQAVESILKQTLTDFELIIVEDPSPRSAAEMLTRWNDSRIRLITNASRTGFVEQLNRGLAEARAKLVARFDADDVAAPARLQRQVDYLDTHPEIGLVGSQLHIIDEHGTGLGYRAYPLHHEAIIRAMRRFNALAHPSVMFRKDVVIQLGGYQFADYHPVEDYELWSRMAVHGLRFANLPEPLISYRVHLEATKVYKGNETLRNTLRVKRDYWRKQMDWRDLARFWAEHILLMLPTAWVRRLFMAVQYQKCLPSVSIPSSGVGPNL